LKNPKSWEKAGAEIPNRLRRMKINTTAKRIFFMGSTPA
jgi:hypothetical protein